VNKIGLSPNSLVGVPALEYIDALVLAGYDGIGLRMYASPGVNYESVTQEATRRFVERYEGRSRSVGPQPRVLADVRKDGRHLSHVDLDRL
jgi:hypothetical protein